MDESWKAYRCALLRVNWTGDVLERMITHENAVDVDMLDVDGTPFPR